MVKLTVYISPFQTFFICRDLLCSSVNLPENNTKCIFDYLCLKINAINLIGLGYQVGNNSKFWPKYWA